MVAVAVVVVSVLAGGTGKEDEVSDGSGGG